MSTDGTSSRLRVLLVDDEIRALALADRALGGSGISCRKARSAAEALDTIRDSRDLDVIVSDIRMPVTDGIAFLERLRSDFAERRWLQIILVTGHASIETAIAAIRLEASDYLLKPLDPAALRESVKHALRRAASLREVGAVRAGSSEARELEEFAGVASELAARMERIGRTPANPAASGVTTLATLELLRRLQTARHTVFGDAVMPEPAWEMLAELMRARLADERLSVTSLALASRSPATTALRRIEDLIQCGLASRVPDSDDRRRTYIELTAKGVERMQVFLEGFARTVVRASGA